MSKQGISGFPEWLPQEQALFEQMINIARQHFLQAGGQMIATPSVERVETLLAKGGDDKEIYTLQRLHGDEDSGLGLRFDLTVPLARYVVQHNRQLTFPFRRGQIQPVWRGERAQAGRYREFYQCDFDIVARDHLPLLHDGEILAMVAHLLHALQLPAFCLRINHRGLLQSLLGHYGLPPAARPKALHSLDQLEKTSPEIVASQLTALGLQHCDEFMGWLHAKDSKQLLQQLAQLPLDDKGQKALHDLAQILAYLQAMTVPETCYRLDLSIARGLDYYTGMVFETQLNDYPQLGSIASGGRYDDLTGLFSRQSYPGVGMSIGLTRLFYQLKILNQLPLLTQNNPSVCILHLEPAYLADYLSWTQQLRQQGFIAEVFAQPKKLPAQLKYATQKGFQWALIYGSAEQQQQQLLAKDLRQGQQHCLPLSNGIQHLQALITGTA